MKNFPSNENVEKEPDVVEWFDREKVIKALAQLGLIRDYETKLAIVLRNSGFPFQRVVLPSYKKLHIELLKLYAQDLRIPFPRFIKLLT